MGQAPRQEAWASGASYEPFMGRWSRLVARAFLAWLAPPAGGRWLDVGCGTGALSAAILAEAAPAAVTGVDPSPAFVAFARASPASRGARFAVGDARTLPVADAAVDVAVAGLALNFVPGPGRAVAEMARATRPGGLVGAYVWDYAGGMEMLRRFWDAAGALDPAARALDEGARFPLCRPGPLGDLFRGAGLGAVAVRAIEVETAFGDFEDYWAPFLGGQGPAPGYVAALGEDRRAALRERLRASLPARPDGAIPLRARAWAVRGQRA